MKKYKKIINKISKNYKDYFSKYLITNIGLIIFTLYMLIYNDLYLEGDVAEASLLLFISSCFLIESIFDKDYKKKWYLYLIALALSISIGFMLQNDMQLMHLYLGLIYICITLGLFFIFRKVDKISNYLVKVFYNLFKVGLFTLILLGGFGIIHIIVSALIIEGYSVEFYDKIVYVILGLYTIPFSIMSLILVKDDIPELINILIRRVLLILLDVSFVVVIIYILKILITANIPQNELFIAGFLIFGFAYPMFIMLGNYKGKLEEFNCKFCPYLLIVTIGLQLYSIIVRIDNYGFTDIRYVGIFCILFEIIALFLLLFKNKKFIKYDFLVLAIMSLIVFVLPVTNCLEAPVRLQVMRLESIWTVDTEINDLSRSDRQKIKDIYEYLNERYDNPDKYLPNHLTMERINSYLMNTRLEFEDKTNYYTFEYTKGDLDISEYNKLEVFSYEGRSLSLDKIKITINEEDIYIKDEIRMLINDEIGKELIIKNSNGDALFVNAINLYYDEDTNLVENFSIKGYILSK